MLKSSKNARGGGGCTASSPRMAWTAEAVLAAGAGAKAAGESTMATRAEGARRPSACEKATLWRTACRGRHSRRRALLYYC